MPKSFTIKGKSGDAVQATMANSFVQNTSFTNEKVFDETDTTTMIIKKVTIAGNLKNQSSPVEIVIDGNDECTITVEYDEP